MLFFYLVNINFNSNINVLLCNYIPVLCASLEILILFWNLKKKSTSINVRILRSSKNFNGSVLFPIGKEEEVVNIHPRAMFIPQNGWTFLAAGIFCIFSLYSAMYSSFTLPKLFQAPSSMLPVSECGCNTCCPAFQRDQKQIVDKKCGGMLSRRRVNKFVVQSIIRHFKKCSSD